MPHAPLHSFQMKSLLDHIVILKSFRTFTPELRQMKSVYRFTHPDWILFQIQLKIKLN